MRRTEQRRAAVWALYQSDLLDRPLGESLPRDVHSITFAIGRRIPAPSLLVNGAPAFYATVRNG